ncbi:uncharacterized protein NEMAJ01_0897 [Nematocida major]|uniref:uncharacterized protein n=1 Tax=Nematocida major TaxID=1912982 RepID=UPI002008C199|nr:uncharacterized protein NEMAJ01_0897 [Nematocida major]KAH9386001.1 hypothetical protein NEMAJ01_0897 [Nematocida major]
MDGKKSEISILVQEKRYEEIIKHPEATKEHIAVALIKMDRYREALKFCHNNTFEKGYCYYKLGKYKSALHTAGRKKGNAWATLRSQIYYKLDRPVEAMNELKMKLTGPVLVNYASSVGMACVANSLKNAETEVQNLLERVKSEPVDIQGEVLYNLAFSYLPDKKLMHQKLEEIDTPDRDHRDLVNSQIYNLEGKYKEISPNILNKSNRAIHRYNAEGIQTPCLLESMKQFQKDTYYQNKIRQYGKTKDVAEICSMIEELKQGNLKPIVKFLSKMSRKNAHRMKKILEAEGIQNKSLAKIISKK